MSYETNDKMVSHPDHYQSGRYEVIDIIDEFTKDLSGTEAVCTANAIKYILRWKKKNGIQDVKKAIWYLQHMVDKEEERLQEEHVEFDEELLKKKEKSCSNCDHENLDPNKFPCRTCYTTVHDDEPLGWDPKKEDVEKKKLEPGCDKCEISECKFLEDPFMNPPYNVLWDKWKEQKETIKKLMHDKKEMQDSIDFLEDDKKELEKCNKEYVEINSDLWEKINQLKIKNHEIRSDLKCLISNDLNNLEEIDNHADNADLVRKWCRRAGVDVQKINDRYFTANDMDIDDGGME